MTHFHLIIIWIILKFLSDPFASFSWTIWIPIWPTPSISDAMIKKILIPYIPKKRKASTGSVAPATGNPQKELYWSCIVFGLLKYLCQYNSYRIIRRKETISQQFHRLHPCILKSENTNTIALVRISPVLSKNKRILFSFWANWSYPSGLFFSHFILGTNNMIRYISPTYENPKCILKHRTIKNFINICTDNIQTLCFNLVNLFYPVKSICKCFRCWRCFS